MAICSVCEDVSQSLTTSYQNNTYLPTNTSFYDCHVSLPNGPSISDSSIGGQVFNASSDGGPIRTHYGDVVLKFSSIKASSNRWSPDRGGLNPSCRKANATQCLLYWCVNTYESRVSEGRFSEEIKASWYSAEIKWWEPDFNDGVSFNPKMPSNDSDRKGNENFTISRTTSKSLWQSLISKLRLDSTSDGTVVSCPVYGMACGGYDSSDLTQIFYETEMNKLFAGIAKSMTRWMRDLSPSSQMELVTKILNKSVNPSDFEPAHGTATYTHVSVSVRWPWLAFPATLILLTTIFLVLTIINTVRHDVAAWKSSPLPMLFFPILKRMKWNV